MGTVALSAVPLFCPGADMDGVNVLFENMDRIHTTEMGEERIRKNLGLGDVDAVDWCRSAIMKKDAQIFRQGKNWYVRSCGCVVTVNASSYTIITAHREKENGKTRF